MSVSIRGSDAEEQIHIEHPVTEFCREPHMEVSKGDFGTPGSRILNGIFFVLSKRRRTPLHFWTEIFAGPGTIVPHDVLLRPPGRGDNDSSS
jgi:hypothetical protein